MTVSNPSYSLPFLIIIVSTRLPFLWSRAPFSLLISLYFECDVHSVVLGHVSPYLTTTRWTMPSSLLFFTPPLLATFFSLPTYLLLHGEQCRLLFSPFLLFSGHPGILYCATRPVQNVSWTGTLLLHILHCLFRRVTSHTCDWRSPSLFPHSPNSPLILPWVCTFSTYPSSFLQMLRWLHCWHCKHL